MQLYLVYLEMAMGPVPRFPPHGDLIGISRGVLKIIEHFRYRFFWQNAHTKINKDQ
jgi:hypothetical protein